jgi:phage terminase small subunit
VDILNKIEERLNKIGSQLGDSPAARVRLAMEEVDKDELDVFVAKKHA